MKNLNKKTILLFTLLVVAFRVLALDVLPSANPQKVDVLRHSYAENSVLQSGKFVKIGIRESGIYRLTYEDIQSMGISPENVRIFGYGGALLEQSFLLPKHDDLPEIAIYMYKGADNVFGAGDYILFYGQGITKWTYESDRKTFTHQQNIYSDFGYYFVTSDAGVGKKISLADAITEHISETPITTFQDYKVHENDLVNLLDINGADGGGREFYGETFLQTRSYDFNFSFPNIISSEEIKVKLDVAAASPNTDSYFKLSLNNSQTKTLTVRKLSSSSSYMYAQTAQSVYTFTADKAELNFNLKHTVTESSAKGFLNYLQMNVHRELKMSGSAMSFRNVEHLGADTNQRYVLENANSNVKIWNITEATDIYELPTVTSNNTLEFVEKGSGLQQLIALDLSQAHTFPKPMVIGGVENQNLHALTDVDYVILTHSDFLSQANELANAHRTHNALTVSVVTTDQVYNEFSSGVPDATAYRWVMKMLYDRAKSGVGVAPRYLLLLGDGTYDNRKRFPNSGENKILTYQAKNSTVEAEAYVTDDYFGYLDDNEGLSDVYDKMDIAVGRFPVSTPTEATDLVDKTIRYIKDENKENWKNQLVFMGDDGGSGDGYSHMSQMDYVAENILTNNKSYLGNKIYLDAYKQVISASGEDYPLAKNKLDNLLRNGMLTFFYMGHGNPLYIANEQMVTISDIKTMTNENMAFWAFGTCSFGKFDSQLPSGAEEAVLNPNGGAIAFITAARTVYAEQNKIFLNYLGQNLFKKSNDVHYSIGDAVRIAKNLAYTTQINRLSFVYLGDPAIQLAFPDDYKVATTAINKNSINVPDTLRALSLVTIEGAVLDESDALVEQFNGKVHVLVRDKEEIVTTQDNHNEVETEKHFKFKDRSSTLFNGMVDVEDGKFKIEFMLPKDIKYSYGTGDINYYAYDVTTGEEGSGNFNNFIVGGGTDSIFTDESGPAMKLYLNSSDFRPQGKVNERPVFFAELSDENGINSVGSGIGHDLMLIVDDNPAFSYVLNDRFTTVQNDYTTGVVRYKLPQLEVGKHILTFRAWDLLNNSSSQSFEFEVVEGLSPVINSVSSYPNPVTKGGKVNIVVNHDRPDEVLETIVHIFDVSGRLLYTIEATNANAIAWDLNSMSINQGVYLYQVKIKTSDSEYTSLTNKIVVVGQ